MCTDVIGYNLASCTDAIGYNLATCTDVTGNSLADLLGACHSSIFVVLLQYSYLYGSHWR